jgi:hypothetical protein
MQGGEVVRYELLYLRGRHIRSLVVPDHIDVLRTLHEREQRARRFRSAFGVHKRRDKTRDLNSLQPERKPSSVTDAG